MNNSFTMNGWDLWHMENFMGMLGSLFLTLIQWLCLIIYFFESIFWALVRGIPCGVDSSGVPNEYKNILDAVLFDGDNVFDWKNNSISALVVLFIIIGFILIILMSVIAIFKSHLSVKEEDKNPKNVIMGGLKAVLLMIIFPVIVYCLLKVTNALVDSVCLYNNINTSVKTSVANRIFYMFANGKSSNSSNWYFDDGSAKFSFFLNDSYFDKIGTDKSSIWEKLHIIDFIGGDYEKEIGGYDYLLAILVLCVLGIGLFKAIMLLGKRIFDVIVLYIVAPFPIACVPNDDGKRFEAWKDMIVAKILSAFGLALSFGIYLTIMEELNKDFTQIADAHKWQFKVLSLGLDNYGAFNPGMILTIVYILILISGGLAIPQINTMLASLVSSSAGQVAGQDMSNLNADMAFMQRGAHAIGAGALFAADKTGVLDKAKMLVTGSSGASANNKVNPLAKAQGVAGGQNGTNGTTAKQPGVIRNTLSAIGKTTGTNKGVAGVAGKVAKGGLALAAVGAGGFLGLGGLAIAGGIGAMGATGTALGAKKFAKDFMEDRNLKKQNKITHKVNEALQNYQDKDKLAKINQDIKKLGGREVNDQFVMEKLKEKEMAQIANEKASSLSFTPEYPNAGKGKPKVAETSKKEMLRQNEVAKKTNEALSNYSDKDKLAELNKEIKGLGGREVNDQFVMEKFAEKQQAKKDAETANKVASSLSVEKPFPNALNKEEKQAYKQEKRNEHLDQKLRDAQWKHQAEQAKLAEKQAKKDAKTKAKDVKE